MTPKPAYGIGGRAADRAAFYAAACDPRRSVVVEACAGAGKTWMLVSRILRALLDGADPQQILAITFTRKAAGEMRARLDEWLAGFAGPACSHEVRVRELVARGVAPAEAETLAPRLGALHEQVLASGRSVQIHTFHAWFAQLLSHAPIGLLRALGLPLAYQLLEQREPLRDALLRRFHRRVQQQPELRALYLGLVQRHGRHTLLAWIDAAWASASDLARADAAGVLADAVEPASARWAECDGLDDPAELLYGTLGDDLNALASELGRGGLNAQKAADGLRRALETSDAAAGFACAWNALFTDKGEARKALGDGPLAGQAVAALQSVRAMRLQQHGHEDHLAMVHLARVLLAEYAAIKRQRGLVDMDDLEFAAGRLLADGEMAAWVQERLDQRLRHLLIDEFQDTSPSQWHAIEPWLSSYAGAGGGASGQRPLSLFVVGDPKQSIYRFRGAEPRVFAAARTLVVQALDGLALECDHTRRNAPAVVRSLNAVFGAMAVDGWGPFRDHTTEADAEGSVRALPGVVRPERMARGAARTHWRDSLTEPRREPERVLRAEEAARVAQAIEDLMAAHRLAAGEVMVLARRRAPLADVAEALAARGIAHALAEPLALAEVPEVLDLIALLDVLASPGHDLSLARALKSPLFGAGDDDLLHLARASAARGAPWLEVLLDGGAVGRLALERARGLLAGWCVAVHRLPPHDLLDRIVAEGDVMARMAAVVPPARRAFALQALQALLGAALDHDGGRFATAYGFVRELRAGRVQAKRGAPADAVQLLTVHGAKGLEARAVVLMDCDPTPPSNNGPLVLVDWPAESRTPRRAAFVRGPSALPPSLADTWAARQAEATREEGNGLYVAMTRAREWLVFSHTEAGRGGPAPSWWARVRDHATPWNPEPPTAGWPRPALADSASLPMLPTLRWRPTTVGAARRDASDARDARDARAARFGSALHRMLEWAGRPGAPLARPDRVAACAAAAAAFGLPPAAAADLLERADAILDSPQCAAFFGGPHLRWAGNEVSLAEGGEVLRIDRLVALADGSGDGAVTWWVLDYKLERDPAEQPELRAQLARYVAAVRAAQPDDRVRGAFVAADGRLVEP